MQNIVLKNYGSNAIKWQKTYSNDYGDRMFDIGYDMNIKLKAIQRQLNIKRSEIVNSDLFQQRVQRNNYGNAMWNPFQQLKESDSMIKLVQWQAKARNRRLGQHQLCKFCS